MKLSTNVYLQATVETLYMKLISSLVYLIWLIVRLFSWIILLSLIDLFCAHSLEIDKMIFSYLYLFFDSLKSMYEVVNQC
jgi:hypothetical protein